MIGEFANVDLSDVEEEKLKTEYGKFHCGCYVSDDDPSLAANDKCSAFDLLEACERALHCIDNAYSQIVGVLDMTSAVGRDRAFIEAAILKAKSDR